MIYAESSQSIVGTAMKMPNALKPGLDEKIYGRALKIDLEKHGHLVEARREFPAYCEGHKVGGLVADRIVDGRVLVDTKVVSGFHDAHLARTIDYPAIADLKLGLLLDFKDSDLGWKRTVG